MTQPQTQGNYRPIKVFHKMFTMSRLMSTVHSSTISGTLALGHSLLHVEMLLILINIQVRNDS